MIFQLKPPGISNYIHLLCLIIGGYVFVCFCNHGMSWAIPGLSNFAKACITATLSGLAEVRHAGDAMGFTWIHPGDHRGPFWFKKRTQLMENDEQMMKTHGHWMGKKWIERNWWRLVAQICGLLAFFLLPWEGWLGASVSRFRKSDELQGFKLESGSMWPRGYEQPQSVTVPCNTNILCTTHGVFSPKSIALHCPGGKLQTILHRWAYKIYKTQFHWCMAYAYAWRLRHTAEKSRQMLGSSDCAATQSDSV